jgi:ArsR family transcriptional regulator, arsenate/arsenite/antimonite-responsive transcriptional repressor
MATQVRSLERVFQALADGTRLRILGLLLSGEVCVCNLHESLGEPQSKVSRHLAYLRRAGLVATRRDGLWVHYRLAEAADPVLAAILQAVTHALGHVDSIRRDTRALEKATGCALPPPQACQPSFDCCSPRKPAGVR